MSVIDIPVVEGSGSLRGAPEQEAASSKPTILMTMTGTEPDVVVVSPEVELVDHVVQIRVGPEKCTTTAGGFEREEREGKAHNVSEEVFVDDLIGSCAGIKVMGESAAECPVVFARPQSKQFSLNLSPLLASPD